MTPHKTRFSPLMPGVALAALVLAGCASAPGPDAERLESLKPTEQMQMAMQDHAAGRFDQAAEGFGHAAEALADDPASRAAALSNQGAALIGAGRYQEAVTALEEAKKLTPKEFRIRFNLALAYTKLGRFDQARLAYLAAGQLAPDDADVPYNLGILYEIYLNQPQDALDAYRDYLAKGGPEAARVKAWIAAIEQRQAN